MISVKDTNVQEHTQLVNIVKNTWDFFTSEEINLLVELIDSYFAVNKEKYFLKVAKDTDTGKILGFALYRKADLNNFYWEIYWLVISSEN